jgi:acyl-CoA thioester hydrolase
MARSDFIFFHTMRVRYSEIDLQGVVFNAHYLTYLDVAHTEYMRAMKYDYGQEVKDTGVDFHLAKASVEYKKPVFFDDQFDICIRASRLGNSSITLVFEMFKTGTDKLLACGEKTDVCVDLKSHESVRIPASLRKTMQDFEGKDLSS